MKASRLLIPAAALLAAYTFASWVVGAKVESALNEQYRLLESVPYLKIVERKYERGIFSSAETATFELMGDVVRAMEKARQETATDEAGEVGQAAVPLRFSVHSRISHGPLPRLSMFAAALSESELALDEQVPSELRKALGERKPLTARTVYRFDGGGSTDIVSPAFSARMPGRPDDPPGKIDWEGFTATIAFERNLAAYTLRGEAPKLEIVDDEGAGLALAGFKLEADQKRVFGDEPLLYAGTQRITIAQLGVLSGSAESEAPSALASQISYDIAMPLEGEFLDVSEKIGAAKLQVGEADYGPVRFEFSLRRLHARALADFYRELMKLYSTPEALAAATTAGDALAPLAARGQALLRHNPELRIDRLSFRTEQGEAAVSASLRVKDARSEDFADPALLMARLEAGADIAVPETLLAGLPFGPTGQAEDCEDGAADAEAPPVFALEQQLALFAQQGYITRADGMVRSKLEFRGGQLTVNGKPFSPAGTAPTAVR